MTEMKQNLWIQVITKINDLKEEYPNDRFIHVYRQWITREFKDVWTSTIDMYILMLTRAGYLRKITPGHYSRVKKIPLDIPMNKFYKNYGTPDPYEETKIECVEEELYKLLD